MLIAILASAYALLHSSYVQTKLVAYYMYRIEKTTGVKMNIGGVDFRPFKSVVLNDVLLMDNRADTLLYCEDMRVEIDSFSFFSNRMIITDVLLDNAYFNLWTERGKDNALMNIEVFLHSLFKRDSLENGNSSEKDDSWYTRLQKIRVRNSRFRYRESIYEDVSYGINWTDIVCSDLNLDIINPNFVSDSITLHVENLNLVEKSGFVINRLNGNLIFGDSVMLVTDALVETPHSNANLDLLRYNWTPGHGDWKYFIRQMNQRYELAPSSISFVDLAYFNSNLLGITNTVQCSGIVSNTIDHLEGTQIEVTMGDSWMRGSFKSEGLPRFFGTNFDIDIEDSYLLPDDLESIYMPWFGYNIYIPENLHNFDGFKMQGKFSGLPEDFIIDATSSTPGLRGKILFAYEPLEKEDTTTVRMSGYYNLSYLDASRLMDWPLIGGTCLAGNYDFLYDTLGTRGTASSYISALRLNDGFLRDIDVLWAVDGDWMDFSANCTNENTLFNFVMTHTTTDTSSSWVSSGSLNMKDLASFGLTFTDKKETFQGAFDFDYTRASDSVETGTCIFKDFIYTTPFDSLYVESINFDSYTKKGLSTVKMFSPLADMTLEGKNLSSMTRKDFYGVVAGYLPALAADKAEGAKDIQFTCQMNVKAADRIMNIVRPNFFIAPEVSLYAEVDNLKNRMYLTANTDGFSFYGITMDNPSILVTGNNKTLKIQSKADEMRYYDMFSISDFSNEGLIGNNTVENTVLWGGLYNQDKGEISTRTVFSSLEGDGYKTRMFINPSDIFVGDTLWKVNKAEITSIGKDINVDDLKLSCGDQYLSMNGKISENPVDSLILDVHDFVLFDMKSIAENAKTSVNKTSNKNLFGKVGGRVILRDYYNEHIIYSDIYVQDWGLDCDTLGTLAITSNWDATNKLMNFYAGNKGVEENHFSLDGFYSPIGDSLNMNVNFYGMDIERLKPYVSNYFTELKGGLTGIVSVTGHPKKPVYSGYISFDSVAMKSRQLNAWLYSNDAVYFTDSGISFLDFVIRDQNKQEARIDGGIDFVNQIYDVDVSCDNFLILNSVYGSSLEMITGRLYISGIANATNRSGLTDITVKVEPSDMSDLFIPLSSFAMDDDNSFIHFVNVYQPEKKKFVVQTNLQRVNVNAQVSFNEKLKMQLMFDQALGDLLTMTGSGDVQLEMRSNGQIDVFGDYNIAKGNYLFTLGGILNKNFVLRQGGRIAWNGSPYMGMIDVEAAYNLRTSLSELLSSTNDISDRSAKVAVECVLSLTDEFTNPSVKFDINFPSLDSQTKGFIQSLFSSQDEKNKQMFSLLMLNRFYKPDYMNSESDESDMGTQAGVTTASELVSNQFSRWLSQISNNVDVDFAYRRGDEYDSDEIELALSTQLFNDRVMFSANGNMDVGSSRSSTTNKSNTGVAGDFDLDVRLNRTGTLKLKTYSHTDEKVLYKSNNETVQGVGVSYEENFDTFGELARKYFGFLSRKKNRDKKMNDRDLQDRTVMRDE